MTTDITPWPPVKYNAARAAAHPSSDDFLTGDELEDALRRWAAKEHARRESEMCRQALAAQDASNLCGLLQSWAQWTRELVDMGLDTDAIARHPISVLMADKCYGLTGDTNYDDAYDDAQEMANGPAVESID